MEKKTLHWHISKRNDTAGNRPTWILRTHSVQCYYVQTSSYLCLGPIVRKQAVRTNEQPLALFKTEMWVRHSPSPPPQILLLCLMTGEKNGDNELLRAWGRQNDPRRLRWAMIYFRPDEWKSTRTSDGSLGAWKVNECRCTRVKRGGYANDAWRPRAT